MLHNIITIFVLAAHGYVIIEKIKLMIMKTDFLNPALIGDRERRFLENIIQIHFRNFVTYLLPIV